ncbi:MAG: serine O-acetyltransferase [Aquabacterium sp.]|uniref:serine O-acetyltransferase n=1 Tax=Aquabacterium sp. TaxID=1872578 RepID=UPI0012188AE1|nr:serine O-acetyltransferase [Aquabacterium sp.]TAK86737.1 MAG: serine O-acetyltransferase [Aquabacterium sp.]
MKREDPALEAIQAMSANDQSQASSQPSWWSCLKEDVACVLARDPAARNRFEVWTIYPGVQAMALHRLAHALWRAGWRFMPRWLSFVARWFTNVDIHPGARIGRRFFIDHGAGVVIGETAEIGDDVTLYHGVTLGGTTWQPGKRHPTLGDGVVVGAGAKILGAITIGHRARVAANSVVIDNVPEAATVVGIPGRVVIREEHRKSSAKAGMAINLDHHLIPDPVGKAIGCLLDRISELEHELKLIRHMTSPDATVESICQSCDDTCSQPTFSTAYSPSSRRQTGA